MDQSAILREIEAERKDLMPVRQANWRDEMALFELLVEMHHYNKDGWGFPYDTDLVLRHIEQGTRPEPSTRSDPTDQIRGVIGVVDNPNGHGLVATVGCFIHQAVWYSHAKLVSEIWLYTSPDHRSEGYHLKLRDFARWVHKRVKDPDQGRFLLSTGFVDDSLDNREQFDRMDLLWQRMWGRSAKKVGALYWID